MKLLGNIGCRPTPPVPTLALGTPRYRGQLLNFRSYVVFTLRNFKTTHYTPITNSALFVYPSNVVLYSFSLSFSVGVRSNYKMSPKPNRREQTTGLNERNRGYGLALVCWLVRDSPPRFSSCFKFRFGKKLKSPWLHRSSLETEVATHLRAREPKLYRSSKLGLVTRGSF